MINLLVFVAVIAVIVILAKSVVLKPSRRSTTEEKPETTPATKPERETQPAKPDGPAAEETVAPAAETSQKPAPPEPEPDATPSADKELAAAAEPLTRHRIYQQRVEEAYRQRKSEQGEAMLLHYAAQHLAEFDDIAPALKASNGGQLPQVNTFKYYATALSERGRHEEAIAVCQKALAYGLKDGTKTGYQGRLERIQAKQSKQDA